MNFIIGFLHEKMMTVKSHHLRQMYCEFLIKAIDRKLARQNTKFIDIPIVKNNSSIISLNQLPTIKEEKEIAEGSHNQQLVVENHIQEKGTIIVLKEQTEESSRTTQIKLYQQGKFQPSAHEWNQNRILKCGCTRVWVQQKADEHYKWVVANKKKYHCCCCGKPTSRSNTIDGQECGYYQVCETCHRNKTYDVTKEHWYNKPCGICDQPMTEKVNVSYQTDVCSEICKYVLLAVTSAKEFKHIPQRIRHYMDVQNCNEDEELLLEAAETYYIKKYGYPTEEEYQHKYNNTESWNDARTRIRDEVDRIWRRTADFFVNYQEDHPTDQAYIDELNRAFIENREAIIEKIPKILDLSKHPQHKKDYINLCHGCIMPYDDIDLITIGNKFLCKYIQGRNEEPCYKEKGKDKETVDPEVEKYLNRRNEEFQGRFILYLNKNKQRVNDTTHPYECERCENHLIRSQVQQVVRNISCGNCAKAWAEELYQQEKENGTLNEKTKQKTGGQGSRTKREENRRGKPL